MQTAAQRHRREPRDPVRDAFRELHGRHLHGFALLLLLGDAPRAAQLAVDALDAGTRRIDELRHPERAAAWLRGRVVRASRGMRAWSRRPAERFQPLAELGADSAAVAGLGALDHLERAAIIAASIERLDRGDVATVVGRQGPALDRILARAHRRYAAAYGAAVPDGVPPGPLVDRVRAIAMRAMG